MDMLPYGPPPYPHEDIGAARASCFGDHQLCLDQLWADACEAGADVMHSYVEGRDGNSQTIAVTFARKTNGAPPAAAKP